MDVLRAHAAITSVDVDGRPQITIEVEWPEIFRRRHGGESPQLSVALVAEDRSSIPTGAPSTTPERELRARERRRRRAERRDDLAQRRRAVREAQTARILAARAALEVVP